MSDDKISITELVEALRSSLVYPYGDEAHIDVVTLIEELLRIKDAREEYR